MTNIDSRTVTLEFEPVELYKILKFEAVVGSGGEAKMLINDGQVRVNGVVETRKRKKIVAGDCIEVFETKLLITTLASPS